MFREQRYVLCLVDSICLENSLQLGFPSMCWDVSNRKEHWNVTSSALGLSLLGPCIARALAIARASKDVMMDRSRIAWTVAEVSGSNVDLSHRRSIPSGISTHLVADWCTER